MTLFKQWTKLIEGQTKETFDDFWKEYSEAETKIYSDILDHPDQPVDGTLGELAEKYEVRPIIFMGFLDGINESIKEQNDLDTFDETTPVHLEIIPETLYYNMLKADAQHLYSVEGWDDILTEDERKQITKDFRRSGTVVKGKKIGRNDPCPCGSGKKYKHCCGRNA